MKVKNSCLSTSSLLKPFGISAFVLVACCIHSSVVFSQSVAGAPATDCSTVNAIARKIYERVHAANKQAEVLKARAFSQIFWDLNSLSTNCSHVKQIATELTLGGYGPQSASGTGPNFPGQGGKVEQNLIMGSKGNVSGSEVEKFMQSGKELGISNKELIDLMRARQVPNPPSGIDLQGKPPVK
jgi:hypothetical protein